LQQPPVAETPLITPFALTRRPLQYFQRRGCNSTFENRGNIDTRRIFTTGTRVATSPLETFLFLTPRARKLPGGCIGQIENIPQLDTPGYILPAELQKAT